MIIILKYTFCSSVQFFPLGINSRRESIMTKDAVHIKFSLMPVAKPKRFEAIRFLPAVEGGTVSLQSAVRAACSFLVAGCCCWRHQTCFSPCPSPTSLSLVHLLIPELSGNCSSWKKFLVLLNCAEDLSVPRTGLGLMNLFGVDRMEKVHS